MPDDVGSFADEAARLADAVQGWARGEGGGRASAAVGHMATGDAACCVCPVCVVIELLRGERPELTSRLTDSLAGLVTAGQGLLETLSTVVAETRGAQNGARTNGAYTDGAPSNASPNDASSNDPTPTSPAPRVQNIPID